MNLFAAAEANRERIRDRAVALRQDLDDENLDEFDRFEVLITTAGRITMNMTPTRVLEFLVHGHHLSAHETAEAEAVRTGEAANEVFARRQREWSEKRVAFETHFEDGHRFIYGALNIGGAGVTDWGDFCLVVDPEVATAAERLAYVPGNSLKLYVRGDLSVDEDRVRDEVGDHEVRASVALLKYANAIADRPAVDWPGVVCSGDDFIETILVEHLGMAEVEEVRMPGAAYDRVLALALDDPTAWAPTDVQFARAFADLQAKAQSDDVPIVRVADV